MRDEASLPGVPVPLALHRSDQHLDVSDLGPGFGEGFSGRWLGDAVRVGFPKNLEIGGLSRARRNTLTGMGGWLGGLGGRREGKGVL